MTRALLIAWLLIGGAAHAAGTGDTMNVRINPLGVLAGGLNLNLDVVIHPHWTLGPELNYWDLRVASNDGNKYDIYAVGGGVRANWFANGVFVDGLYVGPSLTVARKRLRSTNSGGSATIDRTTGVVTGVVGYAWYWTSFNVHLGGGASVDLNDQAVDVKNSYGTRTSVRTSITRFTAEISVGLTF